MIDSTKFNRKYILWIIAFSAGLFLYYVDHKFLQFGLGTYKLNAVFNDLHTFSYIFKYDLLRFAISIIAGFLLYSIFNRNFRYIILTWLIWVTIHYFLISVWFSRPFWFMQNHIDFIKHFLSSLPFILGSFLYTKWTPFQKVLSSVYAKIIVISLGIISLFLILHPIIWLMNYKGYKASQKYNIIIPQDATNIKHQWNWRTGVKNISFTYDSQTPENLFSFYDSILVDFIPIPDKNREWFVVTPEMNDPELRKFIYVYWINNKDNLLFMIAIHSYSKDPPDIYTVWIAAGPVPDLKTMERLKIHPLD